MNFDQIDFSFISADSPLYHAALELRFKVLFQPFELKKDIVEDEMEGISMHFSASYSGALLGYARLTLAGEQAIISQMVIEEDVRKQGIGAEILRHLVEKAIASGVKKISLNSRLKAIKFYEKFGFKAIGDVFASPKTRLLHMKLEKPLL